MATHLRATVALVVLVLGTGVLAPHRAIADDYDTEFERFARLLDGTDATSEERAGALQRFAFFASANKESDRALVVLFGVLRGEHLLSDERIATIREGIAPAQAGIDELTARARNDHNRLPQADIDRLTDLKARVAHLADVADSNRFVRASVVRALGNWFEDAASRAAIIRAIGSDNLLLQSACIEAVRKAGWSDAWDALVSAFASPDAPVRTLSLVALRTLDATRAMPILVKAINDPQFQVRVQAVIGLRAVRTAEAIDALVERMDKEPAGRLQTNIRHALQDLTGRREYEDAAVWRAWWKAKRETFHIPPPSHPEWHDPYDHGDVRIPCSMHIGSKHPVFVVDRSGSMMVSAHPDDPLVDQLGTPLPPPPGHLSRWDVCRKQMMEAIRSMSARESFAIVPFADAPDPYESGLAVSATDAHKDHADRTSAGWSPELERETGMYEALHAAFEVCAGATDDGVRPVVGRFGETRLNADTIILISDGHSNCGHPLSGIAPTNPPDGPGYNRALVDEVSRWNETRGLTIHCVCIGEDGDEEFLSTLAMRNGGTFRTVVASSR